MSKALPASCVAGAVTAGTPALPVTATVLSEGVAASEGLVLIDEDVAYYFPKTSGDLKTTLEQVVAALTQTKTALDKVVLSLTAIDAKPTGGTGSASTPVATSNIALVTTAATAVEAAKTALNTLKGAMR